MAYQLMVNYATYTIFLQAFTGFFMATMLK